MCGRLGSFLHEPPFGGPFLLTEVRTFYHQSIYCINLISQVIKGQDEVHFKIRTKESIVYLFLYDSKCLLHSYVYRFTSAADLFVLQSTKIPLHLYTLYIVYKLIGQILYTLYRQCSYTNQESFSCGLFSSLNHPLQLTLHNNKHFLSQIHYTVNHIELL